MRGSRSAYANNSSWCVCVTAFTVGGRSASRTAPHARQRSICLDVATAAGEHSSGGALTVDQQYRAARLPHGWRWAQRSDSGVQRAGRPLTARTPLYARTMQHRRSAVVLFTDKVRGRAGRPVGRHAALQSSPSLQCLRLGSQAAGAGRLCAPDSFIHRQTARLGPYPCGSRPDGEDWGELATGENHLLVLVRDVPDSAAAEAGAPGPASPVISLLNWVVLAHQSLHSQPDIRLRHATPTRGAFRE